jgi:sulfatase-like protein
VKRKNSGVPLVSSPFNRKADCMADAPFATIPPLRRSMPIERALFGSTFRARWSPAAAVTASVVLSIVLFAGIQRPAFDDILRLAQTMRPGPDAWLLPAALISTSLLLLAPATLASVVLAMLHRPRGSRFVFIGMSSVALTLAMVDLDLLRSIGRHVGELLGIALQPHGHVAGGDLQGWIWMIAQRAVLALLASTAIALLCQWVVSSIIERLSSFLRRCLSATGLVGLFAFNLAPAMLLQAWRNNPLVERIYASAVFDARADSGSEDVPEKLDPGLARLYPRLTTAYKAAFPVITAGRPGDTSGVPLVGRPPNVVLIVTESLRHDVFGAELMPRITRWAQAGLVSTQHDSGTIYSQSGMFSILYGRSPALFHQTLDAHVPPQLCETLRHSGYECAYFTGHPKEWQRREEYLNEHTMDHFIHDDRGTWPEWDQRALDGMVQMVKTSEKPIFAIVLLMSSHFEYQYPPEYEIDRPVSNTSWRVTMLSTLGPEAEVPHRNRYRNTIRFIDDIVGKAIDQLDPTRNLVVFTGDHGESINDDGHYTHGYSFAEIVTRTPFAMVGPGVKPARLSQPTSHIDILPSVLHALTGRHEAVAHIQGIDWFSDEARTSRFEAHSPPGGRTVEAQLRYKGYHVRFDLDLERPHVAILGFEDELAHLVPTPDLSEQEAVAIGASFDNQLDLLRR